MQAVLSYHALPLIGNEMKRTLLLDLTRAVDEKAKRYNLWFT